MTNTNSFLARAGVQMSLLSLIAVLTAPGVGRAQLPVISGGTHVRLWVGQPSVVVQGTLFSQTPDTIRVANDGLVHVIPAASIAGVQVGGGRSHWAGGVRGAKIG